MQLPTPKFHVVKGQAQSHSLTRTVHFDKGLYDSVKELSAATGVSFHGIVNQCLQYALQNFEAEEDDGYMKRP